MYYPVRSGRCAILRIAIANNFQCFSTLSSQSAHNGYSHEGRSVGFGADSGSDLAIILGRISPGCGEDEVFQSLLSDPGCDSMELSHDLVGKLLHCLKEDWKSALGAFRWAESRPGYKPLPEFYDKMVDILGKTKKMDKMCALVEEMSENRIVTLGTIGKVMRRFAGAGEWKGAVRVFDELEKYGLEKNAESMNLLLDTLCKENRVHQARDIFLELKSHIPPNAHTFNIFVHGWCKANMVDEAHWTIQEMKGHGFSPCVISYSTVIQSYCNQSHFDKVYELLDEMKAQGCQPNVVTFTTVMCSLTKFNKYKEALQISERMRSVGCKPDTLFYNALIHALGRANRLKDAADVLKVEMQIYGVKPNTSTYNTLIAMFCYHRREQTALDFLREMECSPYCKPDVQSYYPLLKSCFRDGKTDDLLPKLLDEMMNKHYLSLDLSTYSLLIHGLCRSDKCEWAYRIFEEMIAKEIRPRFQTCSLLLEEIKQKNMFDAAKRIEEFMDKLKSSKKSLN